MSEFSVESMPIADAAVEGATLVCVWLDRAAKRNALTREMLDGVCRVFADVESDHPGATALLLGGRGETFCAGFDLALCRDDVSAMATLLTGLSRCIRAIRRAPLPVVVAAQGGAIAGGCALLSAADIVVTDRNAQLGYPVVRLGVSPAVTSPLLALHIGEASTRERLLDPGLIDGAEAARIGLAHELAESPEDASALAMRIALSLGAKPRSGVRATKRWLGRLDRSFDDRLLDGALQASLSLAGGPEERARLSAMWRRGT